MDTESSLDLTPTLQLTRWQRYQWYKNTRYYEARLHQDLWGTWILTRHWGRRGATIGQSKNELCESYEQGLERLDAVIQRREKRGYTRIDESIV